VVTIGPQHRRQPVHQNRVGAAAGDLLEEGALADRAHRVTPVGQQDDPQSPPPGLGHEAQDVVQAGFPRQRAIRRAADDRPVGGRIGERHGQFQTVDTVRVEHRHHVGQLVQGRITGVEEQHEPGTVVGPGEEVSHERAPPGCHFP
jgi:hypothetical protein